jgi:hypothetical protein
MLDSLTIDQVSAAADDVFQYDKVIFLTIEETEGRFRLTSREMDCQARSFGPVGHMDVWESSRLPKDCTRMVAAAFKPLIRVEQSRGRSATARVRAGGLVYHEHSISRVAQGDVFRPVIRRNDRNGDPKPGGIQEVDWTYVVVRESQDYLLDCEVLSAMRNPLAGRVSASVEKFGISVHSEGKQTELRLVDREDKERPLQGYEVFAKKPLPKDVEEPNNAVRLGLTDWRGKIAVPPDDLPLRLIYIKNGTHLIARIPIVPGYRSDVTLELPSDDKRLETEAFVKGMESLVMDLVARREILAARIQRRIDQGNIEDARRLLDEIKSFRTKDDLDIMLTNRQQAGLMSTNEREQARIDYLLSGTRILINKYLGADQLVALERKVEEAERLGPSAAKPKSALAEQPAEMPEQPAEDEEAIAQ